MIARVGASVSLSLAIAAGAAVLIHRPEHLPVAVEISKPGPRTALAERPAPVPTPAVPWPEPEVRAVETKPTSVGKIVQKTTRKRPDSAFTEARNGETLAEVAERVYGTGIDLRAFWKVNRDQLATMDAPIRAGMVLRTPDLP